MTKKTNELNTVKKHRIKAGLLITDLAQKTQIPEIVLHGIEACQNPARLSQVDKISKVLQIPTATLFPKAIKACQKYLKKKRFEELYNDHESLCKFESLGIDFSGRIFTFKFKLSNGPEVCHRIDYRTYCRIKRVVHNLVDYVEQGDTGFFVYQTESENVILNLRELIFCHFLYDPDAGFIEFNEEEDGAEELGRPVVVHVINEAKPFYFGADADKIEMDVENDVCGSIKTQFQDIIMDSDMFGGNDYHMLSFIDEDGEEAMFRFSRVSLMTIPIELANPKIHESIMYDFCQAADRDNLLYEEDGVDEFDETPAACTCQTEEGNGDTDVEDVDGGDGQNLSIEFSS